MDQETRKEIEHLEDVLEDIRDNTRRPSWKAALNGLLYGAGVVVGTVAGIALLGWILAIFGILPGFGEITQKLQDIMNSKF